MIFMMIFAMIFFWGKINFSNFLLRNGVVDNVYAKYLVPGDIVYLSVGDRIPADVRLVRVNELSVDESSFTGETEPKYKSTGRQFNSIKITLCMIV